MAMVRSGKASWLQIGRPSMVSSERGEQLPQCLRRTLSISPCLDEEGAVAALRGTDGGRLCCRAGTRGGRDCGQGCFR